MKKSILFSCLFFTVALLFGQISTEHKISGTVVGYDGESLIGATIRVVGKSKGTITDMSGQFKVVVANDDILRISYVGFPTIDLYPEEIEFEMKGQIVLKEGNWLKEVVITATKVHYTGECTYNTDVWSNKCGDIALSPNISLVARPWQYYPNPTTDGVTVSTEETKGFINVFSSDGKLVARHSVIDVQTKIDMTGLSAGMYFLVYENEDWAQAIGKVSLVRS